MQQANDLEESRRLIPRYLYRTYSARSQGFNNPAGFISQASFVFPKAGNPILYNVPKGLARWEISRHLLWDENLASHWISFTSSLLFALKIAQYRHEVLQEEDVEICIVDTLALETEDVFSTQALFEVYGMPRTLRSEYDCHDEEYLAYNRFTTTAGTAVTSMNRLLHHGLADYYPELFLKGGPAMLPIGACIVALRTLNFATAKPITKAVVATVEALAASFGGVCLKPLVMAFLALRLRYRNDENFISWVTKRFLGMPYKTSILVDHLTFTDPRVLYNGINPDNTPIGSPAPELLQFKNLISDRTSQLQALRLRYVTPKHYFFLLHYLLSFDCCRQDLRTWLAEDEKSQCTTEVSEVFRNSKFHLREFAIAARTSKRHRNAGQSSDLQDVLFAFNGYETLFMRLIDDTCSKLESILDFHSRVDVHDKFLSMMHAWKKWAREFTTLWSTPEQEMAFYIASLSRDAAEDFFHDNSPWSSQLSGELVEKSTMNLIRREGEVITAPRGLPYRLTLKNARAMTDYEERLVNQKWTV